MGVSTFKTYNSTQLNIIGEVERLVTKANEKFPELDMPVPAVTFFNKGVRAGTAFYVSHRLEFNEVLAKENGDSFNETIAHEVAHLITHRLFPYAKQHHGPEFRNIMKGLFGYSGNTYHSYDVSSVKVVRKKQTKYVYVCGCQSFEISGIRHKRNIAGTNRYSCRNCGSVLKFTGKKV